MTHLYFGTKGVTIKHETLLLKTKPQVFLTGHPQPKTIIQSLMLARTPLVTLP